MIEALVLPALLAVQPGVLGDQVEVIEVLGERTCAPADGDITTSQLHLRRPSVEYCFSYRPNADDSTDELTFDETEPRAHLIHLIEIFPVSSVNRAQSHVDAGNNRPAFSNQGAEGTRGVLGLCATGSHDPTNGAAFTIFRLDPGNGNFHRQQAENYAVGQTGGWVNSRLRSGAADGEQTHCAYITLGAGRYEVFMRMSAYDVVWFYEV